MGRKSLKLNRKNFFKIKRNEDSIRDFQDNIKHTSIHIIGVPEGEEKERGREHI